MTGPMHKAVYEALPEPEEREESKLTPDPAPATPAQEPIETPAKDGTEPGAGEPAVAGGEEKKEEAGQAGEGGDSGEKKAKAAPAEPEKTFFDIPDEGKFMLTVEEGKEKVYSGTALKQIVRQARDLDKKNIAFKTEREAWETEREGWKQKQTQEIEERIRTETNRKLFDWGVLQSGPDGKPRLNPLLTRQQAEEAAGAARSEAVREEAGAPKLPRITVEDLGEEGAFVPQKILDTLNSYAERLEQIQARGAQTEQQLVAERERIAREQQEQRARVIYDEINSAVKASKVFGVNETLSEMAANAVIDAIARGWQGKATDFVAGLEKHFQPAPAAASVVGEEEVAAEPPAAAAERKKVPPPPRAAPPAVGSTGRRTGKETATKPKSSPEFGSTAAKRLIEEAIANIE